MELLTFAKGLLQDVAEYVAGYRFGQVVLRQTDKVLWVLEKTARWAVPPPLDQDETPQPELVRPLPWVFFLALLIMLRGARELISVVNLFCGKPPLRSADVVMYIQSRRRYIRALKYQGNRNMRNRSQQRDQSRSWMESASSLLELAMCFRTPTRSYGNNNTTNHSNNDECIKITKLARDQNNTSDKTMELLIEKMMVNINTDSDDDSSYTLTNEQSRNSEESDAAEVNESEVRIEPDVPTSTPLKEVNEPKLNNHDKSLEDEKQVSVCEELTQETENEKQTEVAVVKMDAAKKKPQSPKKQKMANGQAFKGSPKRKKGSQSERRDSDVPLLKITPADESANNGIDVIRRADKND